MSKPKTQDKGKFPRNWRAVDAHFRKAGAMRDRREPRGGARNDTRDLLAEHPELEAEIYAWPKDRVK